MSEEKKVVLLPGKLKSRDEKLQASAPNRWQCRPMGEGAFQSSLKLAGEWGCRWGGGGRQLQSV